ncbi:hypothetical protein [Pseudoalteromonas sp. M8]|uniref:hypothetical protein n=1 Tax=Pseudoalteromonas sp. M8 TaxID=2692624 RepID=UPI001BAE3C43|nr:hypothetical protein [Pseudoalteromonas sp. M8]QUI71269.1 hypothetical protein GSF13_16595 [Pseudoalteromonas sp. M8]
MLVDLIDIEILPMWLVWLDWQFYAHKLSLAICMLVSFVILNINWRGYELTADSYGLTFLVGFCLWVVLCAIRNGQAIG